MNNKIFKLQIKNIAWPFLVAIFFLLDRYLKFIAITYWPNNTRQIFGDLLKFNFVPNSNIAFSLPLSGVWLSVLIAIIIVSITSYTILNAKHLSKLEIFSLSGIILGAISNLIDRLQYGYVIDYLDLKWFTIFNLADTLISVSTVILVIYLLKTKKDSV